MKKIYRSWTKKSIQQRFKNVPQKKDVVLSSQVFRTAINEIKMVPMISPIGDGTLRGRSILCQGIHISRRQSGRFQLFVIETI